MYNGSHVGLSSTTRLRVDGKEHPKYLPACCASNDGMRNPTDVTLSSETHAFRNDNQHQQTFH